MSTENWFSILDVIMATGWAGLAVIAPTRLLQGMDALIALLFAALALR